MKATLTTKSWKSVADERRQLGPLNYIWGRNGSGKSGILEAINLALTGKLPKNYAQTNEQTGKLFRAATGYVELRVVDRWIAVDYSRKGTTSSVKRNTSNTLVGSKEVDLSEWQVNTLALDMEAFEALSPEAKGKYILELCGTQAAEPDEVIRRIRLGIGKELLGSRFEGNFWRSSEYFSPGHLEEYRVFTEKGSGIFDHLSSLTLHRMTGSQIAQHLVKEGGEQARLCKRRHTEWQKELEELDGDLPAQQPRQADVNALREEAEELGRELAQLEAFRHSWKAFERERSDWSSRKVRLNRELEQLRVEERDLGELRSMPERAPTPAPPETSKELPRLRERVEQTKRHCEEARRRDARMAAAKIELKGAERIRDSYHKARVVQIAELIEDVPDEAHKSIATIKDLARDAVRRMQSDLEESKKRCDALSDEIEVLEERAREYSLDSLLAVLKEVNDELREVEAADKAWRKADEERESEFSRSKRAWHDLESKLNDVGRRIESVEREIKRGDRRIQGQENSLIDRRPGGDVAQAEENAKRAQELREQADQMAMDVRRWEIYDEKRRLVRRQEILQSCWKVVQVAARSVREEFLAEAAAPLMGRANHWYQEIKPTESISLRLETDTGKPTCVFEVLRENHRVSQDALSTGEWCLVLAAVQRAAAGRSGGLRVLLIEAQPLDKTNLRHLINMMKATEYTKDDKPLDRLDMVCVATTITPMDMGWDPSSGPWPAGWNSLQMKKMDASTFFPAKAQYEKSYEDFEADGVKARAPSELAPPPQPSYVDSEIRATQEDIDELESRAAEKKLTDDEWIEEFVAWWNKKAVPHFGFRRGLRKIRPSWREGLVAVKAVMPDATARLEAAFDKNPEAGKFSEFNFRWFSSPENCEKFVRGFFGAGKVKERRYREKRDIAESEIRRQAREVAINQMREEDGK